MADRKIIPLLTPRQVAAFERKFVILPTGCWQWIAYRTKGGYGQFNIGYKLYVAHRVAYSHYVGHIPVNLDIDHLCRNRSCVNPAHLEPVTRSENCRRGNTGNHSKR